MPINLQYNLIFKSPRSSINHNSLTVTSNLVILEPRISLQHVMFGVMLILLIPCLFGLLRLAARLLESEDHPGTWES
jgi:hypothetical protein